MFSLIGLFSLTGVPAPALALALMLFQALAQSLTVCKQCAEETDDSPSPSMWSNTTPIKLDLMLISQSPFNCQTLIAKPNNCCNSIRVTTSHTFDKLLVQHGGRHCAETTAGHKTQW